MGWETYTKLRDVTLNVTFYKSFTYLLIYMQNMQIDQLANHYFPVDSDNKTRHKNISQ